MPGGAAANAFQGDFGEAWLEAVAAGANILHGRPASLDFDKADVQLTLLGEYGGTYNPTVKVQVKTATDLRELATGDYSYDLDVVTYDILRRTDHSVPRVLAVIGLSHAGERVRLQEDGTLLVGVGAWVSLRGRPAVSTETTAVHLPRANTIDAEGLRTMLIQHGARRSTVVPEADVWGGVDD